MASFDFSVLFEKVILRKILFLLQYLSCTIYIEFVVILSMLNFA